MPCKREIVSFYISKGTIYILWVTGMSTPYFRTKLILQGSQAACIVRLNCSKGHDDVLALRWLPRGGAAVKVMRIPIHALMRELDPDLEVGGCLGNGLNRPT
jgi:hypothetical protein